MNDGMDNQSCCESTDVISAANDEFLAEVCKALGHPARIAILRKLIASEGCICGDIVDSLPLSQSTVSEHLRVLREAGLVCGTPEGVKRCYCINQEGLRRAGCLVGALLAEPVSGGVSC